MRSDQVTLHRFVIGELTAAGLDRDKLIRDIGLPSWALASPEAYVPSEIFARLWEVAEHELGDPAVPLRVANRYSMGALGLYDYLFSTAPDLGSGLRTLGPYVTAVTTNHRWGLVQDDDEVTLSIEMVDTDGYSRDRIHLWGLAAVVARSRLVIAAPVIPIRVQLRREPPPSLNAFVELFGTTDIEFRAPIDAVTFRAADMNLPLTSTDPTLATVLKPLADALPPPPPLATTWAEQVATALAKALEVGEVSLEAVARRMATSPRTLQRRLMEAGTTWRQEVDRARAARLAEATATGPITRARQAQLLGYTDPGSLRRAARRWSITGSHRRCEQLD
ncbi:AraC family transcriptional regulator ligand-binding domain-containing protein [Nocardia cyriacigeorgica]|uniref:AraC family transcriptional regulator ligand-binding domain-containing protein n=1 Tax=Nocardia cyriacigeorgica TaxID=135487 RepID=UPI0013D2115A|nr:AraC family transcriptional regulator ligand-binding domain-containing protein [Nocardia cyriacigeorgica]MBF6436341.1 AraC family transcriptional regulator [Nocardia cyriacigeorgica]MBF6456674.1 AraC family transcriptional regulator [Nocardia cyriacigeorgica]MBF6480225.1 AraC family transcriptional regulator [Nocardia cyriacigeorgica]MBF6551479.1 AraC family transcriptional regulator [Nocardia cyriacigeorgica]NEW30049.1 AraC family transcriptional regulator [Nocardia cyriacigeorgica]